MRGPSRAAAASLRGRTAESIHSALGRGPGYEGTSAHVLNWPSLVECNPEQKSQKVTAWERPQTAHSGQSHTVLYL